MKKIRETLAEGLPASGSFQTIGKSIVGEMMARTGCDFIIPDLQHGSITWDDLLGVLQGIELGGSNAIVRIPWCDQAMIMRALDLGADGIIVPMVSTVADATKAAEAARYHPRGNRSIGQTRQIYMPAGRTHKDMVEQSNRDVICLVMIETMEGLKNVDAIAAVPGVDGLFLGPADLSLSSDIGLEGFPSSLVFEAADKIVAACEKNKIIPGAASPGSKDIAEDFIKRGMRYIALGQDLSFVAMAAAQHAAYGAEWKKKFKR